MIMNELRYNNIIITINGLSGDPFSKEPGVAGSILVRHKVYSPLAGTESRKKRGDRKKRLNEDVPC